MTARDLEDVDDQEQQAEAANRRIADRSVVARESSWPDCHLAVEAHRQLLEPLVEVVAHRGLHLEHRVGLHPAAPEDQHRLEDAEARARAGPSGSTPLDLAVGDRAVDQRLGDQRDGDRERDAAQRRAEHDGEGGQVRPQVAAQPPERVDAGGRVASERQERWWHRLVDDTTHHRRGEIL